MEKIVLGILVFAIFTVFIGSAAVAQEVYFVPQKSNATYCNTIDIEIWADAAEFGGGQINLTYDSTCGNVTNWVRNTTNFLMGGWSHYDGREWIAFSTMAPQPPLLTGEYMIGTLTIHCVNDSTEGCETPLAFIEPSTLLDDTGKSVTANWIERTLTCTCVTPTPTPALTLTPTPPSGGATKMHTKTPNLLPTQTPTITPTPVPSSPSPTAAASPLVSPTPAPTLSPGGKGELPGFEASFAILGLFVISYLILKRKKEGDKK